MAWQRFVLAPRHPLRSILVWLAISVVLIWTLFPLVWGIVTSLKTGTQVYNSELIPWVQFEPSLRNWRAVMRLPVLREAMLTSAIVSVSVATVAVAMAAPATYGIARMGWTGRW